MDTYWVKDRSLASLEKGFWGTDKPGHFGFSSLEQMTESEVEIMQEARKLYPYVPEIIGYDRQKQQITMTKVVGVHIDDYIKGSGDYCIIDKVRDAAKQLRSKEIVLNHRSEGQYKQGYIAYWDYIPSNIMVDSNKNVWFIDWDASTVFPASRLPDDDNQLDTLCSELEEI